MPIYCPHTATCPFYQNWVEQTGKNGKDIILFGGPRGEEYFFCHALFSVIDGEIPAGANLKRDIRYTNTPTPECSWLNLLDMSHRIELLLEQSVLNKAVARLGDKK